MFLAGLALWGGACALVATLVRNFAASSAALAGNTAAIIAGDERGATGGVDGHAFMLAVTRLSEICIGIVSAGVVHAETDFGGGRRQLATMVRRLDIRDRGQFYHHIGVGWARAPRHATDSS